MSPKKVFANELRSMESGAQVWVCGEVFVGREGAFLDDEGCRVKLIADRSVIAEGGRYCVIGTLIDDCGTKFEIRAQKCFRIPNAAFHKVLWQLEVCELNMFLNEKISPQLL